MQVSPLALFHPPRAAALPISTLWGEGLTDRKRRKGTEAGRRRSWRPPVRFPPPTAGFLLTRGH